MSENYVKQLQDTFDIFEEIRSVTSTNAKAGILRNNESNFILKSILYLTYNPFLMYNVKKIPEYKASNQKFVSTIDNFYNFVILLNQLKSRQITGNEALECVSTLFSCCSQSEQEWYAKVLQKDLKIGLADKGINRVFSGLIPIYEIFLAEKIPAEDLNLDTEKAYKLLPKHMVCQSKIDGFRLNIFVYNDSVVIRTRNGKMISGYDDLEAEALEKLPSGYVYDGEMVSVELEDWIQENIKSGESVAPDRQLFLDAVSHAFSKEKNKKGVFNMFDMISMKEWESGVFVESLGTRYKRISDMISGLSLDTIKVVPTTRVYDKDNKDDLKEIVDLFHYYISVGWEGLMVKNYDATYQFKRSKDLLKMKLMMSLDLEVIDIYMGKEGTKYEGLLGGVYVDYVASDGNHYQVGVGSGWTDYERVLYGMHPELIVGKVIEVNYQSETQNQDGGYSLSFPVKKVIREDK